MSIEDAIHVLFPEMLSLSTSFMGFLVDHLVLVFQMSSWLYIYIYNNYNHHHRHY